MDSFDFASKNQFLIAIGVVDNCRYHFTMSSLFLALVLKSTCLRIRVIDEQEDLSSKLM